jgi:hypothetical protein
MDELSQLDGLEEDMLEALGESVVHKKEDESKVDKTSTNIEIDQIDDLDINIEDHILQEVSNDEESADDILNELDIAIANEIGESEDKVEDIKDNVATIEQQNNISSIKTDDLASLLSQLLNNKTIEITIKIKD